MESSEEVGLSIALGTQIKNDYSIKFGDTGGGSSLGGFRTKDYIDLNGKNKISFYGKFDDSIVDSAGKFCVGLIDKNDVFTQIFITGNPTDNEYKVDITAYDGEYKIVFYCYNDALEHLTAYAELTAIRFISYWWIYYEFIKSPITTIG